MLRIYRTFKWERTGRDDQIEHFKLVSHDELQQFKSNISNWVALPVEEAEKPLHPMAIVPPLETNGVTADRNDPGLKLIGPDGMQKKYLVLSTEERAKGFVRGVRHTYLHAKELGGCGTTTTMGRELAETYARNPHFYSGTYCCYCNTHKPVGANGEFFWDGTFEKVGT